MMAMVSEHATSGKLARPHPVAGRDANSKLNRRLNYVQCSGPLFARPLGRAKVRLAGNCNPPVQFLIQVHHPPSRDREDGGERPRTADKDSESQRRLLKGPRSVDLLLGSLRQRLMDFQQAPGFHMKTQRHWQESEYSLPLSSSRFLSTNIFRIAWPIRDELVPLFG